jgi:hypothetical protein
LDIHGRLPKNDKSKKDADDLLKQTFEFGEQ